MSHTPDRDMWRQSLGGERGQCTWDEGWSGLFLKLYWGLGSSNERATVSRVDHIKSVDVMSLATVSSWVERGRVGKQRPKMVEM